MPDPVRFRHGRLHRYPRRTLLPRNVVRPSYRLLAPPTRFNPDRAILTWDSLQTDVTNKDVYTTYVVRCA